MSFFKSALFKKISLNAGILASGSVISSLIGLISFTLIARVLGSELFGVLALVQAYALIVDKLLNFQSWQALIKYGSELVVNKEISDFKDLLKFGFALDVFTAILATLVGFSFSFIIGYFLGWADDKTNLASLFSIVILFNIQGTPTAILRIYDDFKHFSISSVSGAVLKLALVFIGFIFGYGIWYFVIVTMISQITGYIYLLTSSILLLRRKKIYLNSCPTLDEIRCIPTRFKGIWSFIWTTNFHGTVRMMTLNLDIIIVDSMLGSAATGLYQIAKQFAKIFTQVSQPLYKSIYPELTKLWATKRIFEFKNVVKQFSFLSFCFGATTLLGFIICGKYIILWTVGAEYLEGLPTLLWYLSGVLVSMTAFPITPAVLAMGFPKLSFKALLFSTILYFVCFFVLVSLKGVIGAGVSYLLLYVFWSGIMIIFYFKYLKSILAVGSSVP
ncbi:lipopolysaccharide biosynthesis protein [Flagellimonas hymeniacidonis]|uniref:lipopolysaccharide biosynthesis protein n=1 Tax=Flagellimonas hymeniacidonis TaxID=2603628 RepID=UPI00164FE6B0|nr:oligosaccharide flippase family protein [Flagellimonas hymeniacidonis]